ncbi:MAG: hypothetical protein ABI408_03175 [Gemmatimonadaceae bacterium]
MFTRNARLFLALTAAMPLLFAACKDNNLVTPGNVVGTYNLTLFRGKTPPVVDTYQASDSSSDFPNGGTATWTDGTLTLRSDGTFTEINSVTVAPTGAASHQSAFTSVGTYTSSGGTIVFSAPAQNTSGARNFTGTVTVNSITYQESNGVGFDSFKYQR